MKDAAGIQANNSQGTKNGSTMGSGCNGNGKGGVGSMSNNVRKGKRVRTRSRGKGGGTNTGERGSNGSSSGGAGGGKGGSTSSTKVVGSSSSFHKRNDHSGTGGSAKSSQQQILNSAKDSSSGARHKQQSQMEKSDNKCDEDVLIQFGSLLAKGDPRALVAQADFQQSSNHNEFMMKVRSIVESSADTGNSGNNEVVKGGGRTSVTSHVQWDKRVQRKGGGSNETVTAGGGGGTTGIAEYDRVVPSAAIACPTTSGSGGFKDRGGSNAGRVPNSALKISEKQQQGTSDEQQHQGTDEPLDWISSCSSLNALKLDLLPTLNPQSISPDDPLIVNHHNHSSLHLSHGGNHVLNDVGGLVKPSYSIDHSDPTLSATCCSNGSPTHHPVPIIGGKYSMDDMLASTFGLSFLSPEHMPRPSRRDHEPEQPSELGIPQVQVLKQQHRHHHRHHENNWTGQANQQEQKSTCQQQRQQQPNQCIGSHQTSSFGPPDNIYAAEQEDQHQTLQVPQELWLHCGKPAESRSEPLHVLKSNWQQVQQNHEQPQPLCVHTCLESLRGSIQSGDSWNNEPSTSQASFRKASSCQDENESGDNSTTTYCRENDGKAAAFKWEKEVEDIRWHHPPHHQFTSPPDFLRTLPSPIFTGGDDRLGQATTSGIQDGSSCSSFTSAPLRGISSFEQHSTNISTNSNHHQLKLPLQPESETLQPLPLPCADIGTLWTTESPQLTSAPTQKSVHPYPVQHQPPTMQQSFQQPLQYHHHQHHHGVPQPGISSIGVGSATHVSSYTTPPVPNNSNVTTDTTAESPHHPGLQSLDVHHSSKYNVVHGLHLQHVTTRSGPVVGSQSQSHNHSDVHTSDINSEGSLKLLQILQVQGGGGGGGDSERQNVEVLSARSAMQNHKNCPSQVGDERNVALESSIVEEEEFMKKKLSSSPHLVPKQLSSLPVHNKQHAVNGGSPNSTSPTVIQPLQQDDSLQQVLQHNQPQSHDEKKITCVPNVKEKYKKDDKSLQKSPLPLRSCPKQIGKIFIQGLDSASGGTPYSWQQDRIQFLRPKSPLPIQWQMPVKMFDVDSSTRKVETESEEIEYGDHHNFMVGIYRLGVSSNASCIISKPLLGKDRLQNVNRDNHEASGSIFFFSPKSVGLFIFRIYDDTNHNDTLATSIPWGVAAQGRDLEMNLKIVLSQLKVAANDGKGVMRALYQLSFLFRHMTEMPLPRYAKGMAWAVWLAIIVTWEQVKFPRDDNLDGEKNGYNNPKSPEGGGPRTWHLHISVHDIICAVLDNPICCRLLDLHGPGPQPDPSKDDPPASAALPLRIMAGWQQLWCVLDERFYPTMAALASHYLKDVGFEPNTVPMHGLSMKVLDTLKEQIKVTVPHLLPSQDFFIVREDVRKRLEDLIMRNVPTVPKGAILQVFGSSANGFAVDTADLDMVLMYPSSAVAPERPREVIEALAEVLNAEEFQNVDSRATARIPIVLFKDPETGIECDISVMNPLAVRNSTLLFTYATIDPRVRSLGYILKYWARRRSINNASEGTLSSYGYLLCLVNFLQTRVPPVLPNLQALPADWQRHNNRPGFGSTSQQHSQTQVITRHPFDGRDSNTYFFRPSDESQVQSLRKFASRNNETVGQLLASFFRYFAYEFDYRQNVISIRSGGCLLKELKAEMDCWPLNNRLGIEDPFETWYDVGHVLKRSRHCHIHKEFARAYTILANCSPDNVGRILELLCEPAPSPFKSRHGDVDETEHEDAERLRDYGGGGIGVMDVELQPVLT